MCVHVPCGYSLQTIIKAIASFEIVQCVICLIATGVFAVLTLAYPEDLLSIFNYDISDLRTSSASSSSDALYINATTEQNFTLDAWASLEQLEFELDEENVTTSTTELPPIGVGTYEDDLLRFMNSKGSFQLSVLIMALIYFLCGLTLAVLLLSAAQERHLQKLTVWMVLQSLVNAIRLILFILFLYWMTDTDKRIDIVMCCLLVNFYSLTLLSIVYAHRQDILSLYKRDGRARTRKAENDGGILKQRFIRNV